MGAFRPPFRGEPVAAEAGAGTTVDLGYERTRLAADRTLMAWIRTSVSMISFGFSIYKFFQYLLESNLTAGNLQHAAPRNFGIALVGMGMVLLIIAVLEYFLFLRNLSRRTGQKFTISTALIAAILLSAVGVLVMINLLFRTGPI
jgi:putative membrane protein